jgi:hypothetical protein
LTGVIVDGDAHQRIAKARPEPRRPFVRPRVVSHWPETETALVSSRCRIFGRKTGFHFS